jgi:hypothetical protein
VGELTLDTVGNPNSPANGEEYIVECFVCPRFVAGVSAVFGSVINKEDRKYASGTGCFPESIHLAR